MEKEERKVEHVKHRNKTLAIILRAGTHIDGVEFFTPKEFPLQLGAHVRKSGELIKPHIHRPSPKTIDTIQEMLHIDYGKVEVNFYDNEKREVDSTILNTGDTILFAEGGHGLKILEDTKIIEIKQGPYEGVEKDKEKF